MKNVNYSLSICHLYPDLLNLYGDRGNIITLEKRCIWRGIEIEVVKLSAGEKFERGKYDIVFLGGGQDFDQNIILDDLINLKGRDIINEINEMVVFLCICGGYQMMGEYYMESSGKRLDCLGAIPIVTESGEKRLIGNIVCNSNELVDIGRDPLLVGFENHNGRTFLGEGVKPLAKVLSGFGNNGVDKTEGARYKNTYCTYMHGSFLPRNPDMADNLILKALERKYGRLIQLEQIEVKYENNARLSAQTCKKSLTK